MYIDVKSTYMVFNLIDLSNNINANYEGEFSGDIISSIERNRTITTPIALNGKKKIMDDKTFIEDLNIILKSYYNGNVELFAMKSGISYELMHDLLSGIAEPPLGFYELLRENKPSTQGDNIQIGDKIEINNTGEGAYAYHCDKGCRGLNNCDGEVISVSQSKAEAMHRSACKICY